MRRAQVYSLSFLLFTLFLLLGGRTFGLSLVRGDTPRNAPSITKPHSPYASFPAVRLQHLRPFPCAGGSGGCQPNAHWDSLNGGVDEGVVMTATLFGRIVTSWKISGHFLGSLTACWERFNMFALYTCCAYYSRVQLSAFRSNNWRIDESPLV